MARKRVVRSFLPTDDDADAAATGEQVHSLLQTRSRGREDKMVFAIKRSETMRRSSVT